MPLSAAQKKAVATGCDSCKRWGQVLIWKRQMGAPDPAAEERQQATQATYDAAEQILQEYTKQQKAGQ